ISIVGSAIHNDQWICTRIDRADTPDSDGWILSRLPSTCKDVDPGDRTLDRRGDGSDLLLFQNILSQGDHGTYQRFFRLATIGDHNALFQGLCTLLHLYIKGIGGPYAPFNRSLSD